jgi:hypothetical protein
VRLLQVSAATVVLLTVVNYYLAFTYMHTLAVNNWHYQEVYRPPSLPPMVSPRPDDCRTEEELLVWQQTVMSRAQALTGYTSPDVLLPLLEVSSTADSATIATCVYLALLSYSDFSCV